MESLLEKLRKLDALANRGVDGEKDNARRLLLSLCKKYGVSLESVSSPDRRFCKFHVADDLERSLLFQVACLVLDTDKIPVFNKGRERSFLYLKLTVLEELDIKECFSFYLKEFKTQVRDFFEAFIHKNRLFCTSGSADDSPVDPARLERILAMMQGIERNSWRKPMLSSGDRLALPEGG